MASKDVPKFVLLSELQSKHCAAKDCLMGRQLLQKKMNHIIFRHLRVSRKFPTV